MLPRIEHFVNGLPPEKSRVLFKKSVLRVSIAISSYCNRQCSYCPNSIVDRKSNAYFMSDDLFFNILRQLATIDYSEIIQIHRYNEPLAERDYALSRIGYIRAFLPNAKIHIFTNGDYLDRGYLDQLAKLGVAEIDVTVHAGPGGKTDIESLIYEQNRRMAEYGLKFQISPWDLAEAVAEKHRHGTAVHPDGMKLVINAVDFYRGLETGTAWAYDRGVLKIPRAYVRDKPCMSQFCEMEIEWDGTLLPCCQINNDAFAHDNYVLGKLTPDSDIFSAWTNNAYVAWRVKMSTFEKKDAPCRTCSYGKPSGENLDEVIGLLKNAHEVLNQVAKQGRAEA